MMRSKEELDGLKFELACIKSNPFIAMESIGYTFEKLVRVAELNIKIAQIVLDEATGGKE